MRKSNQLTVDGYTLYVPLAFVMVMWLVYWVEVSFGYNFNDLGVRPDELSGLTGIVFSPFIHGDMAHLWSNTLPVFLLSLALFYFYRSAALRLLIIGLLLTGLLTWFIGEGGTHIGASGVVYYLASYLAVNGFRDKNYRSVAISFIVIFFYGGLIWYVLPIVQGMSWEGHLSGLISGLMIALLFPQRIPVQEYSLSRKRNIDNDAFMRHFDENGNWIDLDEEE